MSRRDCLEHQDRDRRDRQGCNVTRPATNGAVLDHHIGEKIHFDDISDRIDQYGVFPALDRWSVISGSIYAVIPSDFVCIANFKSTANRKWRGPCENSTDSLTPKRHPLRDAGVT